MKSIETLKGKVNRSRRLFLKIIFRSSIIASAGFIFYPIIRFIQPPQKTEAKPNSVLAGKVGELKTNTGKIFRFGKEPGILIKTKEGKLKAFTAVCTHLDCIVQYRSDLEHIWCACHNGHYDLNGINISGPPPRPLKHYKVNVIEDNIFVSKET